MSLPALLVESRQRCRLSQRGLAMRLGLSNMQVARYESGATVPSIERVRQIAEALGVSAQPLLRARRQLAA